MGTGPAYWFFRSQEELEEMRRQQEAAAKAAQMAGADREIELTKQPDGSFSIVKEIECSKSA